MSERVLPEGWVETNLGEIAGDVSYGYTAKATYEELGPKLLRITDIQGGVVNWDNVPYCKLEGKKQGSYFLKKGDLLFARTGATVGKSFLVKGEVPSAVYASYLIRVRALKGVSVFYLAHFFNSQDYWRQITDFSSGIGQPSVNGAKLKILDVPLPPRCEQVVISHKLDNLLAQVKNLKVRLDAIPVILKRFRQSVLAAAVSEALPGSLSPYQSSWKEVDLGSLLSTAFDGPFGSKLKTSDYTDVGVGVSRLENIRHLWFDGSKKTYVSEEKYEELKGNKLEKNDVLFSSFVDEEVRVCLFPYERVEYINKADCFCLRADDEKVLPKFLMFLLASHGSYLQIKAKVQGVTRPRVNLKILKSLKFKVPGVDEQAEIVRHVDQLFAFADQVEQQVANTQARVDKLTQSILAKAFRGELTAEWRAANPELISGENSAKALLERIRAEKI